MISVIAAGIFYFLLVIEYAILFRAILSWFMNPYSAFMRMLVLITEPFIAPVRALINRVMGRPSMFDFSMMITMVLITLLRNTLISIIL